MGARDDAIHTIAHEERQVFALAVRPAHGIADKDAVSGVGEGVFDLDGQLAEEGERHGRNDEADRLRAFSVQGARQGIRAISQRLDRVGDVLLRLFREVSAVVEDARHGRQAHSGQLGDVGQRGFARTHAGFPFLPSVLLHCSWLGGREPSITSARPGLRGAKGRRHAGASEEPVPWFASIYKGDVSHVTVCDIGFCAGI